MIALDVVQMDDILCTCLQNQTIINICIKDSNDSCQLIAFCITPARQEEDFALFMNDLKENHGIPRVFIVDRFEAQKNAIQKNNG